MSTQGVQQLTLEGVAAAGVTKGGLIYHFKTKDDLLAALVQSMLDECDQRTRAKASEAGNGGSAMLLALINDTFDMQSSEKQLMSNLLAAASSYPHLLDPCGSCTTALTGTSPIEFTHGNGAGDQRGHRRHFTA